MGSSHGRLRSLGMASSSVRCCCSFSSLRSLASADCGEVDVITLLCSCRSSGAVYVTLPQQVAHYGSCAEPKSARFGCCTAAWSLPMLPPHVARPPDATCHLHPRVLSCAWVWVCVCVLTHLRHGRALQAAVGVLDDLDGRHLDAAARAHSLRWWGARAIWAQRERVRE